MPAQRSLGLKAFMALAARGTGRAYITKDPRPEGTLVWIHVSSADKKLAAQELAERLQAQRDGVQILMTGPNAESGDSDPDLAPLPDDMIKSATAFLDHWKPDLCLWVGGDLYPCLLALSYERNMPMILIDPNRVTMSVTTRLWGRVLPSAILPQFTTIISDGEETTQALLRKGARREAVVELGEFVDGARLLPYDPDYRAKLLTKLGNRSVWLAAGVQRSELSTVLTAHHRILQFSLRNILVLLPDDLDAVDEFYDQITASDLRVIRASEGYDPRETTQVILADDPNDLGVWYRLAPVCFMGSSLERGMSGRDPNEPAAHGSAILSGPFMDRYQITFDRYVDAGAARMIQSAPELSAAIKDLMPPDKSAVMAQAAWDISSRGAEVMDRVMDLSQDLLDATGAL